MRGCVHHPAWGFAAAVLPDLLQDAELRVANFCSDHAWVPMKNAFAIGFFSFSLLLFFRPKLYLSKIQALELLFSPQYLCSLIMPLPSASCNSASKG